MRGRHKARPLQLLVIEKNDYIELPPQYVLASLGQPAQGCWPAQGSATTNADYRNRMIIGNFPSLFSLRSVNLYKDVGRHKARPLQLLVIEKSDCMELRPLSVLASLGQPVQGCWLAQGTATTTAGY